VVAFASNASAITIEEVDGHFEFGEGGQSAANSAFGFLLIAVAMRMCRNIVYAALLPNFRRSYIFMSASAVPSMLTPCSAAESAVLFALLLPIVVTSSLAVATGLAVAAGIFEFCGRFLAMGFIWFNMRGTQSGTASTGSASGQSFTMSRGVIRDDQGRAVKSFPGAS